MNAPSLLELARLMRDEVNPRRLAVGLTPLTVADLEPLHAEHVALRKEEARQEAWEHLVGRFQGKVNFPAEPAGAILLTEASQVVCDTAPSVLAS